MIREKMKILILGGAVIFLGLSFSNSSSAADLARGLLLYQSNCLPCHGEKGDGNGSEAVTLATKPMDFTSSQMSTLTDSMLEKAVVEGISTVSTHAWGNKLSKDDVADIIRYTRTFKK